MSGMSAHGVGGYGGVSEMWMVVLEWPVYYRGSKNPGACEFRVILLDINPGCVGGWVGDTKGAQNDHQNDMKMEQK